MPFAIRTPDGHVYLVTTECGNGLTQVRVETAPEEEQSIEQTGDEE